MTLKDFTEETFHLIDDYEGKVIATFIKSHKNSAGKPSILYLHGYNDYFFHPHVAQAFHEQGYNFYALDLRKYGRSLLEHQHPNYCRNIDEYYEEIDKALLNIYAENKSEIVLLGHSTGGLIASMYANFGKQKHLISSLVLNSPFFEFNVSKIEKVLTNLVARIISTMYPYAKKNKPMSALYNQSLLSSYYGEWDFNLKWKPEHGFPAYFKWIVAIYDAQQIIKTQSNIKAPVLVMHSQKSEIPKKWKSDYLGMDIVLNINHIKEIGNKLGKKVTFLPVENAIHDIFLSQKQVRETAFNEMLNWLKKMIK